MTVGAAYRQARGGSRAAQHAAGYALGMPASGSTIGATARRFAQVFATLVAMGAVLAVTSGRPGWPMMWVYVLSFAAALALFGGLLARRHPEVIAARASTKSDAQGWDKALVAAVLLLGSPVALVVTGLDERFGWSPDLALPLQIGALASGILAYGFIAWAMASNTHFEGHVRIQTNRHHQVQSGGPYALVRHPGYVGMLINFLALPVALDSLYGLVPAGLGGLLLIVRTALEDRFLRRELDGYEEYAQRVRWRLVPGVW